MRRVRRWLLQALRVAHRAEFLSINVREHPAEAEIKPGYVYVVVTDSGRPKWAYLRCPADAAEVIQLCLMRNHRPRWDLKKDFLGRPSVHPSVRQTDGSFAHFWVNKGRVRWCPDSGKRFS